MKTFAAILLSLLLSFEAQAATLIWDAANTGPLTIERGTSPTGPFTTVATVPTGTTRFVLTPEAWGHYRVTNSAGSSNTVQFSADLNSSLTARVDALEAAVSSLAAPIIPPPLPAPTSNFTITPIDADHVRLVCNGIGITTSGSGTSRTLECRH